MITYSTGNASISPSKVTYLTTYLHCTAELVTEMYHTYVHIVNPLQGLAARSAGWGGEDAGIHAGRAPGGTGGYMYHRPKMEELEMCRAS